MTRTYYRTPRDLNWRVNLIARRCCGGDTCLRRDFVSAPVWNPNDAHCARRKSFAHLDKWLADCRALASPHLVTVLVGNKVDEEDRREVEYSEGARWAQEQGWSGNPSSSRTLTPPGLLFAEVSSLTGANVITPFTQAAKTILAAVESGMLDPNQAGTGISYGERQLRAVGGGSGLRRRRRSINLGDLVGRRRCAC